MPEALVRLLVLLMGAAAAEKGTLMREPCVQAGTGRLVGAAGRALQDTDFDVFMLASQSPHGAKP